jgi:hypothetical protein
MRRLVTARRPPDGEGAYDARDTREDLRIVPTHGARSPSEITRGLWHTRGCRQLVSEERGTCCTQLKTMHAHSLPLSSSLSTLLLPLHHLFPTAAARRLSLVVGPAITSRVHECIWKATYYQHALWSFLPRPRPPAAAPSWRRHRGGGVCSNGGPRSVGVCAEALDDR